MKIKELLKEIKNVFRPPIKKFYVGKIKHYTPYFLPWNFHSTIISIRKLKLRTDEESQNELKKWIRPSEYQITKAKFSNTPMVQRNKHWIWKIFGNYYWFELGWPIIISTTELGWKYKFDSVRFEWSPRFQIYFFKWQFCIFWKAPDGNDAKYYEMILHWIHTPNKDIDVARDTWNWVDYKTKKSTWNDDYLEWYYKDIDLGL